MPLLPEMKLACERNDVALARVHLKAAADNDEAHEHTKLSDSMDVAIAHQSNEVAELLFNMIKGYYRDDSGNMLLALTSNGVSPLRANGNVALADKIQAEIVRVAPVVLASNPDIVMNVFEVDDRVMTERLFAAGIDPDIRSSEFKKHSPLSLAAKNNAANTAQAIFEALKKKYENNPAKLREALLAAPDAQSKPELLLRAHGQTFLADSIAYELDKLDGRDVTPPVSGPTPRSSNPPPLKTDRTLTLARLQEKKPDGRTNLQIFVEQGQLADVFTAPIWQGRQEEMDKAWQQVPAQHQNQLDIKLIRDQIAAFALRDRFRRDGDDLSQGF